jgi:ribosomal protein L32
MCSTLKQCAAPIEAAMSAQGWSPMPEAEAIAWCKNWSFESDVTHFARWTPRVEGANDEISGILTNAVELVWEEVKTLRAPCLTGDGHPAIWFTSHATVDPGPSYKKGDADRAAIDEYHGSIHNPHLPVALTIADHSQQSESPRVEPLDEIVFDIDQVKNRSEEYIANLVLSRIDFSGNWNKREFCGDWWVHEARKAERGRRCPRCGMVGSGEGQIGNERRFFHERNRSCYLGVVENRLKRNPLMKCAKCGEMGREHHGKDGHIRVRHADRTCYVG